LAIVGEARIEDQRRGDGLGDLLPEGDEFVDLVVGLATTEIEDELGRAVLGKDGECALDALAAGAHPIFVDLLGMLVLNSLVALLSGRLDAKEKGKHRFAVSFAGSVQSAVDGSRSSSQTYTTPIRAF